MTGERQNGAIHELLSGIPANATFQGLHPDGYYYYSTPDGAHVPIIPTSEASIQTSTALATTDSNPDKFLVQVEGRTGMELIKQFVGALAPQQVYGSNEVSQYEYAQPPIEVPFFSHDPGQQEFEAYLWLTNQHPSQEEPMMGVIEAAVEPMPQDGPRMLEGATEPIQEQPGPLVPVAAPATEAVPDRAALEQAQADIEAREARERRRKIRGRFRNVGIVAVLMAAAVGPSVHSYENGSIALEACDLDNFAETFSGWDKAGCYAREVAVTSLMSVPNPLP